MSDIQKKRAAIHAVSLVKTKMVVGLGTGSTASYAIAALRSRIEKGELEITGVCTSIKTEEMARELHIPTKPLSAKLDIHIYIDGADQVDGSGNMIKGGGGALLREKLVALKARRRIIVVDESKPAQILGLAHPLPVELVRFGYDTTMERIRRLTGCHPRLRTIGRKPFETDEGHYIADCDFPNGIADPAGTHAALDGISGVVESGLFIGLCDLLVVGTNESVRVTDYTRSTGVRE